MTVTFKNNRHALWLLFWPAQTIWYMLLESHAREMPRFFTVHCFLDDWIPFVPFFVVFYLLWYAYLAWGMIYFTFWDKEGFYKLIAFVYTEIFLTLLFSTIFPNGHSMRPDLSQATDVFSRAVQFLYSADPHCVTVMPSMHVMNAVGVSVAVSHSRRLSGKKWLTVSCWIYTVIVSLSTVLIKQHSVLDVFAAAVVCLLLYFLIYRTKFPVRKKNKGSENAAQ